MKKKLEFSKLKFYLIKSKNDLSKFIDFNLYLKYNYSVSALNFAVQFFSFLFLLRVQMLKVKRLAKLTQAK